MAEKYIVNMPLKSTPDDTDLMIIEDAQDTKRMTWANVVKPVKDSVDTVDNTVAAHLAESANKHITESGSNANGAYIKFDDGTMICRYRTPEVTTNTAVGSLFFGVSAGWTLPASFIDIDWVVFSGIERTSGVPFGARWNKIETTTGLTGLVLFSADNGAKAYIALTAIGRWK